MWSLPINGELFSVQVASNFVFPSANNASKQTDEFALFGILFLYQNYLVIFFRAVAWSSRPQSFEQKLICINRYLEYQPNFWAFSRLFLGLQIKFGLGPGSDLKPRPFTTLRRGRASFSFVVRGNLTKDVFLRDFVSRWSSGSASTL